MNNGIETSPKNLSAWKNEFMMKLFSDWIDVPVSFSEMDEYLAGFIIPPNTWLVSPSMLLLSILIVAIGIKIKTNSKINNGNFR